MRTISNGFNLGLSWLLLFFLCAPASSQDAALCTALIPPGGAYDRLRTQFSSQSRDYLDEIIYIKDFGSHDEALNFGLSLGTLLYGVPLQVGGTVDSSSRTQWRREYESRRIHDVQEDVRQLLISERLNVDVVRIIADCIAAARQDLWISVHTTDECNLSVRAGYTPVSVRPPRVVGRLTAVNATCDPLPRTPLPPRGFTANCVRSSAGRSVTVTVHNRDLGDRSVSIAGVAEPIPPTITEIRERRSERRDLSRGQADQVTGNLNCPDCQTRYGIFFAVPGIIAETRLVNVPPPFVVACPDGGKCQSIPALFSRPDGSPCTGWTDCWVWFLERNHNTPAVYQVDVSYDLVRRMCTANCRTSTLDEASELVAFQNAHQAWERIQARPCLRNQDPNAKLLLAF